MIPSLKFRAQYATTDEALQAAFAGTAGSYAVADLSLGSWSPQSLGTQIMSQIAGRELTFKTNAASFTGALGDAMSSGIDHDCKGNGALLEASATAGQIARLLRQRPAAIYVLAPCAGAPWRTADRLLIEYLASLYPALDLKFVVTLADPTPWPEDWDVTVAGTPSAPANVWSHDRPLEAGDLLSVLPTALSPSVQKALSTTDSTAVIPLPNGWAVVTPSHRRVPAGGDWKATPEQSTALRHPVVRAFSAFVAYHSAPKSTDPWVFGVEGWKHFGSGYHEVALLYMAAALSAARDETEKTTFYCHGQAMRIAMAAYKEAGKADDPAADLPLEARIFLLETKGWGLVMGGSAKEALPYLREALRIAKPSVIDKAYLFLMNITALSEVRSGNSATALDLERAIDDLIAEHNVDDARLLFVNSLNLARLYRYAGDLDLAKKFYNRAFSTVEGARTETDSINANLSLARIAEVRSDHRDAFLHWLRGALHWVASETPEALNWRVQGLVLSKGAVVNVKSIAEAYQLVERLAAAFLEQLEKFSGLCGVGVDLDQDVKAPRFERPHTTAGVVAARVIGGNGWSVIEGSGPVEPREFGPVYERLNRWLSGWVASNGGRRTNGTCYWIDALDGSEMSRTRNEMLSTAAEFKVPELVYELKSVRLDSGDFERLRQGRVANLNPIVSRVEDEGGKTTLTFRRYLKAHALEGDERRLFLDLRAANGAVGQVKAQLTQEGWAGDQVEAVLERLRKARVLQVSSASGAAAVERPGEREMSACAR